MKKRTGHGACASSKSGETVPGYVVPRGSEMAERERKGKVSGPTLEVA